MREPNLLLFVHPLNRAHIKYMVGGSIAAIAYGEPRLTADVDFVVLLSRADIQRIIDISPESDFYVPPREIMAEEAVRGGQFHIIHMSTGFN